MYGLAVLITLDDDLWPVRRPPALRSIPMIAYLTVRNKGNQGKKCHEYFLYILQLHSLLANRIVLKLSVNQASEYSQFSIYPEGILSRHFVTPSRSIQTYQSLTHHRN